MRRHPQRSRRGVGVSLDDAVAAFADRGRRSGPRHDHGSRHPGRAGPGLSCASRHPRGIEWIQPAEMTIRCGAGTSVADVDAALAEHGQCVAIPDFGTIGGALAVGHSGVRRLGWGPVRDTVLQVRYVSAAGTGGEGRRPDGEERQRVRSVPAPGRLTRDARVPRRRHPADPAPTDPRAVVLQRSRPVGRCWESCIDPRRCCGTGRRVGCCSTGIPTTSREQAGTAELVAVDSPPELPPHRWSVPPSSLATLRDEPAGTFVAEIGVGIVHHSHPAPTAEPDRETIELHRRIRHRVRPRWAAQPGTSTSSPAPDGCRRPGVRRSADHRHRRRHLEPHAWPPASGVLLRPMRCVSV